MKLNAELSESLQGSPCKAWSEVAAYNFYTHNEQQLIAVVLSQPGVGRLGVWYCPLKGTKSVVEKVAKLAGDECRSWVIYTHHPLPDVLESEMKAEVNPNIRVTG